MYAFKKKLIAPAVVLGGFLLFGMSSCTTAQIEQAMGTVMQAGQAGTLTQADVSNGLKQALSQGINKGAVQASQPNGFYQNSLIRIPFPKDAQKVENTLRQIGLGAEVDKFILTLNRGAEDAAKSAAPIFLNAIKQMTIADAWNILRGEKDAATQFLKRTTTSQLTAAFNPIMKQSLDKVNATKYYSELVNRYNKIPLVQKMNPDLESYATQKAIDGLFTLVAQEEANIRENPIARTTELMRRVFSAK